MDAKRSSEGYHGVALQLRSRVLFAGPMAAVAVTLIAIGGLAFAIAVAAVAVLALTELLRMVRVPAAVIAVATVCAVALITGGYLEGRDGLVPPLALSLPLLFAAAATWAEAPARAATVGFAVLGVVWVGMALAHGVMLRELSHGGALVTMVLLATFIGDTGAHIVGARLGHRPLAPSISPAKTVEGLFAGIASGTAAAVIFAAGWHGQWLQPYEALLLGLAASLAAPAGDLCESMLKRSVGRKDSGNLLGPHGGVLDRIDAVLFAAVIGYYVALALA